MSSISCSFPSINPLVGNSLATTTLNNINGRTVTYPVYASSLTYGIDLLVETWQEKKYEPCTTGLGKFFDYVTGWTKDENGNPNPSVLDRVINLFTKTKQKENVKEEREEKEDFSIPDGKVRSFEFLEKGEATGIFEVTYWQENCSAPSSISGKWDLRIDIDIPESIENYENRLYNGVETCLINSVLGDYFRSVAEFCNSSTLCGCPKDETIFSYIYFYDQSSLKIFNSDMLVSQVLLPSESYPVPSLELIKQCYEDNVNVMIDEKRETIVILTATSIVGSGVFIGSGVILCMIFFSCFQKSPFDITESNNTEIEMEDLVNDDIDEINP